jgi:CRISPR-associated protein (TIGR03984 family)
MKHEYKIDKCKSQVDFFSDEKEILMQIKAFANAKAVVWYYDKICFCRIENNIWNTPLTELAELVRLRIFDKDSELHIWRSNGLLKSRRRNDSAGDDVEYIIGKPLLNGTSFKTEKTGIVATEEKGIHYHLPYPELEILADTKNRIVLITRNYIGYSDIGQAGFVDCRFVDFEIINTPQNK